MEYLNNKKGGGRDRTNTATRGTGLADTLLLGWTTLQNLNILHFHCTKLLSLWCCLTAVLEKQTHLLSSLLLLLCVVLVAEARAFHTLSLDSATPLNPPNLVWKVNPHCEVLRRQELRNLAYLRWVRLDQFFSFLFFAFVFSVKTLRLNCSGLIGRRQKGLPVYHCHTLSIMTACRRLSLDGAPPCAGTCTPKKCHFCAKYESGIDLVAKAYTNYVIRVDSIPQSIGNLSDKTRFFFLLDISELRHCLPLSLDSTWNLDMNLHNES